MSDPFQPLPLFSFPLFSSILADFDQHRAPLAQLITAHRANHVGLRRSNRDGWHSGEEFLQVRDEHLAWVLHNVLVFGKHALGRFYGNWARHELRLGSWWANVLDPGGWNAPHHHLPQHWSGVYYVRVPDVGTTPDDLHGRIEFLNPNVTQSAYGGGNFAYAPKDGLTLLFPSSLVHLVHPHGGTEPRISIAYNFNVVPTTGA